LCIAPPLLEFVRIGLHTASGRAACECGSIDMIILRLLSCQRVCFRGLGWRTAHLRLYSFGVRELASLWLNWLCCCAGWDEKSTREAAPSRLRVDFAVGLTLSFSSHCHHCHDNPSPLAIADTISLLEDFETTHESSACEYPTQRSKQSGW